MRALITILLFSFSFLFSTNYYVSTGGTDNGVGYGYDMTTTLYDLGLSVN